MKEVVGLISDIFTIAASTIVIYLFFTQKDKIISAINVLLNYSFNLTINELRYKLERLNDYNANEKEHLPIILNILSDIQGQLKGNNILKKQFIEIIVKIQEYIDAPKTLTEPRKRTLVSELREALRGVDISNYKKITN